MQKPFRERIYRESHELVLQTFTEGYKCHRLFLSLKERGSTIVLLLTGDHRQDFFKVLRTFASPENPLEGFYLVSAISEILKEGEKHKIPVDERVYSFIDSIVGDYVNLTYDVELFAIDGPLSPEDFLYGNNNSLHKAVYG